MREIYHDAEQAYMHLNVSGDDVVCLTALRQVHLLANTYSAHASADPAMPINLRVESADSEARKPNQSRSQRELRIWESIIAVFNHAWWG